MSVAQLESELPTLNGTELDALEAALRREKSRRSGRTLSIEETRLFSIINEALPGGEELRILRVALDSCSLDEVNQARLLELENEREVTWARKLRAVAELANLRGEEFETLYSDLGLALRSEA